MGFVRPRRLGEVLAAPLDVVLSEHDVLQPDLIFISTGRSSIATEANIQGAPDLVMEILSPSTAGRDRILKRARYARYGVREYWIVDPESRTDEVLKAGESGLETVRVYPEGTVATSPILEGLRIEVSGMFGWTPAGLQTPGLKARQGPFPYPRRRIGH